MNRVELKPDLLLWARVRAGQSLERLAKKFPRLAAWEAGDERPTLKQLEQFAKAVHVPIGFLFLSKPPDEPLPIPDLRTVGLARLRRPSPDLLDTVYLCQRRQGWYREWARTNGEDRRAFVGSAEIDAPIEQTADKIRDALEFDLDARCQSPTWTEALRQFIAQGESLGILVMVSGVVGSNNHRRLDPNEFRGFALADDLAPLVFINGADTKAAQMFTLAHEIAHLWLGESALSDVAPSSRPSQRIEVWCNRVAAEVLVPLHVLRESSPRTEPLAAVPALARQFKVSTLVILRRLLDARRLTRGEFQAAYIAELERLRGTTKSGGGDFYLTQAVRVSRRFARAIVVSTLEGQTLYRDAFRMLGVTKDATFRELSAQLGYPI